MANILSVERIGAKILVVRGKKVMLDKDLAQLYGVETRALNQAVKRNITRFPADFMFRLTRQEAESLVSQNVIPSIKSLGGYLPYVFTEQGVAMLSSVLNSERAIQANIQIMRAFVQFKRILSTSRDLRRKIEAMERKYDQKFAIVFEAIKRLLEPPKLTKAIGFRID